MDRIRLAVLVVLVLLLTLMLRPDWGDGGIALASAFSVNNSSDNSDGSPGDGFCDTGAVPNLTGICTLRAAIEEANASAGPHTITFAVDFISPQSELPAITRSNVSIVATLGTVVLDGSNAGAGANGLVIRTSNTTVQGLVIQCFQNGVRIEATSSSAANNNTVQGNYIGTDGTNDLGNLGVGVQIIGIANDADYNEISDNVISGNNASGVSISGAQADHNTVRGNLIGTQADGTSPLGNGLHGVVIADGASDNVIGEGGVHPQGNTIAYNDGDGVLVLSGTRNQILSNSIFDNGGLGIDLSDDNAVTPNDDGDTDAGANNLQNYPVLTQASISLGDTIIQGTLNSTPNTQFNIQFFSSPACDPSGYGEGRTYLETYVKATDGSGNATIYSMLIGNLTGQFITAIATDPDGNTSEFSNCIPVPAAPVLTIKKEVQDLNGGDVLPGDTLLYTINYSNTGNAPATGVFIEDVYSVHCATISDVMTGTNFTTWADTGGTLRWPATGGIVLDAQGDGAVSYQCTLEDPFPYGTTEVENTATIDSEQTWPQQDSVAVQVTAAPELAIDKECTPDTGNTPGDTVHCTIHYTNTGHADATGVVLTDDYDQSKGSVSNITGSTHFGRGTDSGDIITWDGSVKVPAGESGQVEYDYILAGAEAFPAGTIQVTNSATMDCNETDAVQDSETFTVTETELTVVKEVVPDDGSLWDFTLSGPTPGTADDLGDGESHTWDGLAEGQYTLSETTQPGYDTTVDCGTKGSDNDHDITFTLEAGDGVICTFTNTKHGTIIVEKQTDPDGAAGSFTFSGNAAGTISDDGQIVVSDLPPGTYTSTEADPGPDFELTSITCDDDNSTGDVDTRTATFVLDPDETVKCTFTNRLRSGTIIVEKQTDPDGAAGSFTFSGDAAGTISDDGQIVVSDLPPGTYTSTEADPGPNFELTSITCDDDNSSGNLTTRTATFVLDPDETVKCTFTNGLHSLQVSKELLWPVGGLAAIGQEVRFNISIENNGGTTVDPLQLLDEYDPRCLTSLRAEFPPDVHGGSLGFLKWNDLGALAPGESTSLWVEFIATGACEETTNTATAQASPLTFSDEVTLRILETIARVGGRFYHDETGDGVHLPGYLGIEEAQASANGLLYTTNTSGWYSFNLLDPGNYHVAASAPPGSWWTPTTAEACDVTVVNTWDKLFCHFGYWWGLDGPPAGALAAAEQQVTLLPVQDTTISGAEPGNHGDEENVWVRQPGLASALVQFELTGLPAGAEIVWARLQLYGSVVSNGNRLYMTAYPLARMWAEEEATWLEATAGLGWDDAGATGAGDHGAPVGWAWIDAPGWAVFDLDTAVVVGWLADPGSNHGFLVRGEGSESRRVACWFLSKEHGNLAAQPRLVIGYNGAAYDVQAAALSVPAARYLEQTWLPLLSR